MAEILVLQHADWELPGAFGDIVAERGMRSRVVRPDRGEPMPELREVAAIVAMGGPMSVNDDLPWLRTEKRFVGDAVSAGLPYFGTCLGAQVLAAAHGARVYRGPRPEYGMHTVTLTPAASREPLFAGLPADIEVFQWHGETFDLPTGAVRLAGTGDYPNQAFMIGRAAYGLQFHLEVTPGLLATWLAVPQCLAEAREHLGHDAADQLTTQVGDAPGHVGQVFHRWLDTVIDFSGVAAAG
jgi:GMP synthase-like glutamine amidotransferase